MTTTARRMSTVALALLLLAATMATLQSRPAEAATANREYMVVKIVEGIADIRELNFATMVQNAGTGCFYDLDTVHPIEDRRAICWAKTNLGIGGTANFYPEATDERAQLARNIDRAGTYMNEVHNVTWSSSHSVGKGWHKGYNGCAYYSDISCGGSYQDNIGNVFHNGDVHAGKVLTCDTNPRRFCPNQNITDTSVDNAVDILDGALDALS